MVGKLFIRPYFFGGVREEGAGWVAMNIPGWCTQEGLGPKKNKIK